MLGNRGRGEGGGRGRRRKWEVGRKVKKWHEEVDEEETEETRKGVKEAAGGGCGK